MLYEILRKEEATVEEMSAAYVAIEENLKDLEAERQTVHAEIIGCKLDGSKGDLSALKDRFSDLGLDLEAAQSALQTLFDRMGERMPIELQQRRTDAQANIRDLQIEGDRLFQAAMGKLADYIIMRENLTGKGHNVNDWVSLRNQYGARFGDGERNQLIELIREKKSGLSKTASIERQIDDLRYEMRRIENILAPWNPQKQIHAALDKFRSRE